jgi:hypothetical protein
MSVGVFHFSPKTQKGSVYGNFLISNHTHDKAHVQENSYFREQEND